MRWVITKDEIAEVTEGTHPSTIGKGYADPEDVTAVMPYRFKLFDDDDILYYEGTASEETFAPLDWAASYAGCTQIEYLDPATGIWSPL